MPKSHNIFTKWLLLTEEIRLEIFRSAHLPDFRVEHLLSDGDSVCSRQNAFEIVGTPVKTYLICKGPENQIRFQGACRGKLLEILSDVIILSPISSVCDYGAVYPIVTPYHCGAVACPLTRDPLFPFSRANLDRSQKRTKKKKSRKKKKIRRMTRRRRRIHRCKLANL